MRTGDKGRDKSGGEKGNFEPGSDVIAKATVLAEGNWGHLTGAALKALDLAPKDPQVWALGVKEVWEVEQPFEKIVHTLGWPLRAGAKWKEFGGSWIYGMNREGETPKVSIGFVTGLDYTDARFSVHDVLQEFKLHPLVKQDPRGRQAHRVGREGDPRGRLLGDAHAARAGHGDRRRRGRDGQRPQAQGHPLRDRVRPPGGGDDLPRSSRPARPTSRPTRQDIYASEMGKELYESRNMKQPFAKGLILGGAITNAMVVTKGRFPGGHWATHRDAEAPLTLSDRHKRYPKPDGKYTFDKLSGVFLTGNATRDDAPSHIRIQQRVPREVGEGWAWMCPAGVYEVPEDAPEEGMIDLIVNPSNCVQCGAITAKGGRLTPPEGGDGPVVPDHVSLPRMSRLIRGGRVVTATDAFDADVLIDGESIVADRHRPLGRRGDRRLRLPGHAGAGRQPHAPLDAVRRHLELRRLRHGHRGRGRRRDDVHRRLHHPVRRRHAEGRARRVARPRRRRRAHRLRLPHGDHRRPAGRDRRDGGLRRSRASRPSRSSWPTRAR